MPKTEVVFYVEEDGTVPLIEWLDELTEKAQLKCLGKVKRLFVANPKRHTFKPSQS